MTDLLEEVTKNMLNLKPLKIIALKELAAAGNYEGLNEIVQSLSNKGNVLYFFGLFQSGSFNQYLKM